MGISVFDTLTYVKKLQAAGVSTIEAEAHAMALAEIIDERLVTKQDISDLKRELKHDIEELRVETRHDISTLQHDVDYLKTEMKQLRIDVREEIRHEIGVSEERLNSRIDKVTFQLTIRLGSLLTAGILLIEALNKII